MAATPDEAIDFFQRASDAESQNRQDALTALKFRYGDQWPTYASLSRGSDRPQLTINETNTYIRKVCNGQRQQRPRGKASPVDSFADKKIAKVITGLGRHIEENSDADYAYDNAYDFAATIGWGYWRLRMDYIACDSFDQDVYIDAIDNPFCVYGDPNGRLPDGSDWEEGMITDLMRKTTFQDKYPGASLQGFTERATGDSDPDWVTQDDIRIAEYFKLEREKAKLVMLTDGTITWSDELPRLVKVMQMLGIGVKGERDSFKTKVKWCKQTAFDILEEKTLPGRWIPIVPVYWTAVTIDSRRIRQGLVKDAMDPQRMVNFWQTSITESIALAPKAKWLIPEGTDEGHEDEWAQANTSSRPGLHYRPTDILGNPAAPSRIAPEPPPSGAIEASFLASQNLSRVMGIFDPGVRGGAQHKSDRTLNAEQGQSEMTNFDGYDNLIRSIKHSWRIMLSWFPVAYDTQRVQRIIGEDGNEELVTLNEKGTKDGEDGPIEHVLNDLTIGTYDVVMDTGPGYDTRRKEGVASMMELMATPLGEKVAATSDDVVVRQMDFPGADVIADRLAAANPLSQVDEKSDIPPKVQMSIKAMQQQIQQLTEQLQAAGVEIKYGLQKEQMRQDAETRRTLMTTTSKAHESEMWAQEEARQVDSVERTKIHDTTVRAMSAQHVEEIKGMVALLLKKLDTAQLEKAADAEEKETLGEMTHE